MLSNALFNFCLQYLHQFMKSAGGFYDRFAVLFTVAIVWIYAAILTAAGVYHKESNNSETPCGTNHAGLIGAAPW